MTANARHFESPLHALVAGEIHGAIVTHAIEIGRLFRSGCEVEFVMDGDDHTPDLRVAVAQHVFVVRVDQVAP